MNVFNGDLLRSSAPTTYGFEKGYIFAISDPDEQLYEYESHDRWVLTAKPLLHPELTQTFTQDEIRQLIKDGKLNPRVKENAARTKPRVRSPLGGSLAIDLSDDEKAELDFYWELCRRIMQMRADRKTSFTDKALRKTIPRVFAQIIYGIDDDADRTPQRTRSSGEATEFPCPRKINARKHIANFSMPAPSTVRGWIRTLDANEWDILALRDHRKGRVGSRAPKITDPQAVSLMQSWINEYLDRGRPTISTLFQLMNGSVTLEEENEKREIQGKKSLKPKDIPSFAAINLERSQNGLPALPVPSKSTFERAIRKLDSYQVTLGREGPYHARRKHRLVGKSRSSTMPGELVVVDCWQTQLMALKLPHEFWVGLPDELIGELGRLRLTFCAAIDDATKVILGANLSVNATAQAAKKTLEMVCRDKSDIAAAAGCRSTWDQACTPSTVASDSGSEFINGDFRCAVRDIGSGNEIGPAKHPDARGTIERFFRTLDTQLMQFFQGRTFSGIADKGDYKSAELANVLAETLGINLVRYIVDVYHNTPHGGLGGQTPNNAWEERAALHSVLPPPPSEVMSIVFGFSDNRRIQNRGISFMGLYFRSKEAGLLRQKVGQQDIRIRVDLEDLGYIWASENVPGAKWFAVPCELDMKGVSAAHWMEAVAALRRRHAKAALHSEHIVVAALNDIRQAGRHSAAARGIGPATLTYEDIKKHEAELVEHFEYKSATRRGRTLEGINQDPSIEPSASQQVTNDSLDQFQIAPKPAFNKSNTPNATPNTSKRRRGRLDSDFLKKD